MPRVVNGPLCEAKLTLASPQLRLHNYLPRLEALVR